MRADLLYKSIIRDFRKFYIKDFNSETNFILKKRFRERTYYYKCISAYLHSKHSDLFDCTHEEKRGMVAPEENLNNLCFFMSCLLYPKDFFLNEMDYEPVEHPEQVQKMKVKDC